MHCHPQLPLCPTSPQILNHSWNPSKGLWRHEVPSPMPLLLTPSITSSRSERFFFFFPFRYTFVNISCTKLLDLLLSTTLFLMCNCQVAQISYIPDVQKEEFIPRYLLYNDTTCNSCPLITGIPLSYEVA